MKGHNCAEMDDAIDSYIRQSVKNWAAQHQPRANGRSRLLLVAASPDAQQARPVDDFSHLFQQYLRRGKLPSDRAIDSYDINWGWAMHMSFAQLRHVA